MKAKQSFGNRRGGFTLVEIMVVVVIIGIIAGIAINPINDALRRGRITSVRGTAAGIKKATADYITKSGGLGVIPITEGTIPTAQFTGTGATSANVASAGTLDQIFLTEGLLESPISVKMGPQTSLVTGTAVTWSVANGQFTATAAPTQNKSTITRAEAQLSTTTAPSSAGGSNFRLDGINDLPTNVRVASLIIPNVPAEDAYQLSLAEDGQDLSATSNNAADDKGKVAYANPTNGVTTVYFYCYHY